MLPASHANVLRMLRRYKIAKRTQFQSLFFPNDKDGSSTRGALRRLGQQGFLKCIRPRENSSAPTIYIPTDAGCSILAAETGDMKHLLDCEPNTRACQNFPHWLTVTDLFLKIDAAIDAQSFIQQPYLWFEHDVLNFDAPEAELKYKLFTKVTDKVSCVPDAASEIVVQIGSQTFHRAYYWEKEMGTNPPKRAAAMKAPGFFGLNQSKLFKRHFPDAQDMRVVAVTPNPGWRDSMRKAMKDKPGADLWLFTAVTDITPATFLHAPIFFTTKDDQPRPFVKAPAAAPGASPPPGACQETREGP